MHNINCTYKYNNK